MLKKRDGCVKRALLAALCFPLISAACTTIGDLSSRVPESESHRAVVGGYSNIRFYADDIASLQSLSQDRIRDVRTAFAGKTVKGRNVDLHYLSISGGGSDGAFGAGLLNGWTASGKRPSFDVVTGISTGALIAPFAFLGPNYDKFLTRAYTTTSTSDVEDTQPLPALLGLAPSLSSNVAFEKLIASFITPELVMAIASEYRRGRMLLIGTTNLDSQRAVIWDIGAIAVSRRADALELIRSIITASASIPGVFPPVRVRVDVDGKTYDELHVDGGVTRQVFLFPPGYDPKSVDKVLGWKAHRHAFIIRNGFVNPQYEAVEEKLLPIASRSISTLIKTQGVGDLYRIYLVSRIESMDFNLAYIPESFTQTSASMFDPIYMKSLYDLGYSQGSQGYRWYKEPPGLDSRRN
jgi:predicted acylesterase/phospholipase RssA